MAPVQFSVLGRVAVAADGSTCGSPVGASVPSSPRFSRLRSLVEPDRAPRAEPRLLISSGGGDALLAEPDCVDAEQFEALDDSDLVRAEKPRRAAESNRRAGIVPWQRRAETRLALLSG